MKFKDICVKKTFQSQGQEKTVWNKVGTLKETDDGKQFVEIFALGDFYVFEQRNKTQQQIPQTQTTDQSTTQQEDFTNIPF